MKNNIYAAVISVLFAPALYGAPADLSGQKAALETGSQEAKLAAVEALKAEPDPAAQALLASRLKAETDPAVKAQLLEAVDVNRAPAALEGARAALGDANPEVQRSAVMSLSRYRRFDSLIPDMQKAFSQASPGVRSWIINAYGLNPSSSSVAALDAVAADAANTVELRQMAISALGRLGSAGKKAAAGHAADKNPVISKEAAKASAPRAAAGKPAAAKPAAPKKPSAQKSAVKPAAPGAAVKKPAAVKPAAKDAPVKGTAR